MCHLTEGAQNYLERLDKIVNEPRYTCVFCGEGFDEGYKFDADKICVDCYSPSEYKELETESLKVEILS